MKGKVIRNPLQARASAREGRRQIEKAMKQDELKPWLNRFQSPAGYEDWNDHIAMSWIVGMGMLKNHDLLINADRNSASAMATLLAHVALLQDSPPRYLSKRLAEAFLRTDLPALKNPPEAALPSFRLFLPKGLLKNENDISVNAIVVVDREQLGKLFQQEGLTEYRKEPGLSILIHTISGESYFADFMWHEPMGLLNRRTDTPHEIREMLYKATSLAAQSVMAMATMPELIVVDDPKVVTAGRGFARSSDEPRPAPPTWIGREFRTHVVQPVIRKGQSPSSTGLQIRPHWRQGHWRAVACGPKWRDHRLKWIQPCFVGKHTLQTSQ